MPAPPAKSSISGTPTNAVANGGFAAFWDYVTGLLGMSGNAADARTALEAAKSGAITGSGLTMVTARALGRLTAGTGAPEELTSAQVTASLVDAASTSAAGKVRLATTGEAQTADPAGVLTGASLKAAQIQLGTAVASTSGTAIDFTGIPSWAKRITVMFDGVSTDGTSIIQLQLGDSGGVETTGYVAGSVSAFGATAGTAFTTGFGIRTSNTAAALYYGSMTFNRLGGNTWEGSGIMYAAASIGIGMQAGTKTLSDTLDRIRVTTVNGTDTFDAGSINVSWE